VLANTYYGPYSDKSGLNALGYSSLPVHMVINMLVFSCCFLLEIMRSFCFVGYVYFTIKVTFNVYLLLP